jgi:hypothetical protein
MNMAVIESFLEIALVLRMVCKFGLTEKVPGIWVDCFPISGDVCQHLFMRHVIWSHMGVNHFWITTCCTLDPRFTHDSTMIESKDLRLFLLAAGFLVVGCEQKKPLTPPRPKGATPSALPAQPPQGASLPLESLSPNLAEPAIGQESTSSSGLKKIDSQILLALKQAQGETSNDNVTKFQPDIPVIDGARVGIDLNAAVSEGLLKHIALIGGQVIEVVEEAGSPSGPAHIVRAMIPLTQMEALAGRADIKSLSPTRPSVTKSNNPEPLSQPGVPRTKP